MSYRTTALSALLTTLVTSACEMPPAERAEPLSDTFTLLWTGAIRGELDPCDCPQIPYGGLARLASTVESELALDPEALLIDLGDFAGDQVGGEGDGDIERLERAWITLEALGMMGFQALVPGERDLKLGALNLRRAAQEARIDILSTNLWLEDPAEPLGVTELWLQTRVGPVALLAITAPLDEPLLNAAAQGHDRQLQVVAPAVSLELILDDIEREAAAVVIVAHGPTDWARDLLTELDGSYLMVLAHDDERHAGYQPVGESYLITSGREGHQLGRLRITVHEGGGYGVGGTGIDVVAEYGDDPEVAALVATLDDRVEAATERLDQANEGALHPSGREFVGFSSCSSADCHPDQTSAWYETDHVGAFRSLQQIGWQVEAECFECHTTGFGYAGGFQGRAATPTLSGVGCESCHGPGDDCEGRDRPEVTEVTCRGCHTVETSPDFDYEAMLPLISH
jgi:2',3'-cyclic-nucleotide 2'-phosphodiesterase (5'-nucleotidase family)